MGRVNILGNWCHTPPLLASKMVEFFNWVRVEGDHASFLACEEVLDYFTASNFTERKTVYISLVAEWCFFATEYN